jgi:hypothetical protein
MVWGAAGELARELACPLPTAVNGRSDHVVPPSIDLAIPFTMETHNGPGDPFWASTALSRGTCGSDVSAAREVLFAAVALTAPPARKYNPPVGVPI